MSIGTGMNAQQHVSPSSVRLFCLFLAFGATLATGQLFGFTPLIHSSTESLGGGTALGLPIFAAGYALGMLLLGPLAGVFGPRRILFLSLFFGGLMSFVAAASPSVPFLLSTRFLEGLALGGFPPAAFVAATQKVPPKLVLLSNSAMVFGLLGSAGLMGIFSRLLIHYTGWRTVLISYAILLLAASIMAALVSGTHPIPSAPAVPYPTFLAEIRVFAIALSCLCGATVMASFVRINGSIQSGNHANAGLFLVLAIVLGLIALFPVVSKFDPRHRRTVGLAMVLASYLPFGSQSPVSLLSLALATVGATLAVPASIHIVVSSSTRFKPAAISLFTASLFAGGALSGLFTTGIIHTGNNIFSYLLVLVCLVCLLVSTFLSITISQSGRRAGSSAPTTR